MRRALVLTRQGMLIVPTLAVLACGGGDLTLPADAGPPADLLRVSGDDQSAPPGDDLPAPLVVKVVDGDGHGVGSAPVTWVVGAGGGEVSPATAVTDSQGLASARLTLGPDKGENLVSAVVSGLEAVTFTASAESGGGGGDGPGTEPHHLVFQVQPSEVEEDERIEPAVVVAVVDESGRIVPGVKLGVQLVLLGGWAELEGHREAETKDGVASFDDLEIDRSGTYVLRAFVPEALVLGFAQSEPFAVRDD